MKTQTIAQFLNITLFPHYINDQHGNALYIETAHGSWVKNQYDNDGYLTYTEFSDGYWCNYETSTAANPLDINATNNIYEKTIFKSTKEISPQQVAERYGIALKELKYR